MKTKQECRIIPEETNPKFFSQQLKAYEFARPGVSGKIVLDLGCGDGYGAAFLAKAAQEIIAIDYEKEIVVKARKKYNAPNLKFVSMDVTDLGFKDESFDTLCSFQVVEHIPEERLSSYFLEIKRVLKNEGEFYISTLNLANNIKSPLTYKRDPAHCKEFYFEEFKTLLEGAFANVQIYGLYLTPRHKFYLRLKKTGIFNSFPQSLNPVKRFYDKVTTNDFRVLPINSQKPIDFFAICKKLLK
ncbi:MAG: class I SAM-dependent methyltransferase [Candidatus Omnitrophota bacterium]